MTPNSQNRTILILSANPEGTPKRRLNEEMREIEEGLERARQRDRFSLKTKLAVRYRDISRAILDYEPHIIHFAGSGVGENGLVFEDLNGQVKIVSTEALANLFALFADKVECVVLNACYSQPQAEAIAQHIKYVVGMSQEIGDKAAIEFAVGFYDALGAGRSYNFAYKLGCNGIALAGIAEKLTPKLLVKKNIDSPLSSASQIADEDEDKIDFKQSQKIITESTIRKEETSILKFEQHIAELESLLKSSKWKDADQKTTQIIFYFHGIELETGLLINDIRNLSCQVLLDINELWMKYSDEKFGLTIQQQIWQQQQTSSKSFLKKILNPFSKDKITNNNENEMWYLFGEKVGWYVEHKPNQTKKWVPYERLDFHLNAPEGHLPYFRKWWKKAWHHEPNRFCALMETIKKCQ